MPDPTGDSRTARAWRLLALGALAILAWGTIDALRTSPIPPTASPSGKETPLSLNSATYEELLMVPGLTPRLARAIMTHREAHGPFRSLAGLEAVPGIGPKTIEKLKPYLQPFPERVEK